jgi:hypothetical protein
LEKKMTEEQLLEAAPNAVIYSEEAWAAARKSSDGADRWFVDSGSYSHNSGQASGFDLLAWTSDWRLLS